MRQLIPVAAILGGCAYHPGTLHDRTGEWPPTRTTTACLDLAFARHDRADTPGAVIAYRIGNRCDHRVVVDLASIRAVGRDGASREVALAPHDPRHELRPLQLAALWSGEAEIAYGSEPVDSLCIDVAGIDRDARGGEPERWVCFARREP